MQPIIDSLAILTKDWNILLPLLAAVLLGAATLWVGLRGLDLTLPDYVSLSLGGSWLALLASAGPFFLLKTLFGLQINFFIFPILLLVGVFSITKPLYTEYALKKPGQAEITESHEKGFKNTVFSVFLRFFRVFRVPVCPVNSTLVLLVIFLLISTYLRLAFLSGLLLPPYFDSASHYTVIQQLMNGTFAFTGAYYHLGFHFLVAALSLGLSAAPQEVMLVFGQVLLALLPLPLYFLVHRATKSEVAGLFALLLAGWGWQMPAHALNWGKYPALTSLLPFGFVLCVALLWTEAPRPRWKLALLCALGILAATLTHSRSLALVGIALVSVLLAAGWQRLPLTGRILTFGLALGGLAALLRTVDSVPILRLAFPPYWGSAPWLTLLVGLLGLFALLTFPRATFTVVLALCGLLSALFVPVIGLPGYDYQTLLDRPFVELVLYFPLALLGGLGLAGLLRVLEQARIPRLSPAWPVGLLVTLVFGATLANAFLHYSLYPSPCCRIFWDDDAVAFDWMAQNLPPDARILIASSELYVLDTDEKKAPVGADAGIWIKPLLGKQTVFLPNATNFGVQRTRTALCQREIGYIYVGGGHTGFDATRLSRLKTWYTPLLSLPDASLYEVIGCAR